MTSCGGRAVGGINENLSLLSKRQDREANKRIYNPRVICYVEFGCVKLVKGYYVDGGTC